MPSRELLVVHTPEVKVEILHFIQVMRKRGWEVTNLDLIGVEERHFQDFTMLVDMTHHVLVFVTENMLEHGLFQRVIEHLQGRPFLPVFIGETQMPMRWREYYLVSIRLQRSFSRDTKGHETLVEALSKK